MTSIPENELHETPENPHALWEGDLGTLGEQSRRALLELLKGPYLSGRRRPQLWQALVADEAVIRSRLHELFLDVVIDRQDEFAFTRRVDTDELTTPSALRTEAMSFLDTAMLLVLRGHLLASAGERRVVVGKQEIYEQLAVYREGDDAAWAKRLNGSWTRMLNRFNVLHKVEEDRAEISPVLKVVIGPEQAASFTELYRGIAERGTSTSDTDDSAETEEDTA
ncbi:hypothetical protein FM125_09580 [Micrococcus lylae]|uniref:DUF4194 domain-containing protein n=1 Tax=Micrococcus lylae TaxID=1273 RepID=A0A1R4JN00_9MICC|nr:MULTISPECIES: DUF4194 domain-containing protein [Micrococcus]MCT2006598.1 DUF4194 domain-containing protein [Micrococcus lylae]MCT2070541.1 DUF4194 domain-containing protein [Micrococcus lylae]PNL16989.1 DUF4194 domain-containing protein [Micrococcus sp. FDAARGOS_333]TFH97943.1 DUF4194 domain-containing protein [Micrococcus lylae]WIK81747.1 DUF4194 domain-containing protein [Micrococcus lylae]